MSSPLPEGLTPDMMAAIAGYLQQQKLESEQAVRPSGTLQPHQIRGVNPRYSYVYRPYPKALLPPKVTLKSEDEERTFRSQKVMPLPWPNQPAIDHYYATRKYPVTIQPPQIVVRTAAEEAARRAEWNEAMGDVSSYPRYMFHPTEQPRMVNSVEEEESLGMGWFPTIKEATDEALSMNRAEENHRGRQALFEEAKHLGLDVNPSWGNKRLQEAIDKAKQKEAA